MIQRATTTEIIAPKSGFNFRQMLRDGRDDLINLVDGAFQGTAKYKMAYK